MSYYTYVTIHVRHDAELLTERLNQAGPEIHHERVDRAHSFTCLKYGHGIVGQINYADEDGLLTVVRQALEVPTWRGSWDPCVLTVRRENADDFTVHRLTPDGHWVDG